MENHDIFVEFIIEYQLVVVLQNIGPFHHHGAALMNEEAILDALSAADTDDFFADVPDLVDADFYFDIN